MNAVEFQAIVHNGVITLPCNQQSWNGKKIKVILLDESGQDVTETKNEAQVLPDATTRSANDSKSESDFFESAGIWKNRNISLESIRSEAWRDNKK